MTHCHLWGSLGSWAASSACFITSVATRQPAPMPFRPQASQSGKLEVVFFFFFLVFCFLTSADSPRIL